ncbi:uncharacterized protein [Aegilops tauschii subsp. strangulata]|uniref:uncharacterized protein n=1 Tax=Aegilops tauschii subsp. strangulata TaxID=200361 RepID=UPI001ABC9795|nr:uncharacterized protein LOC109760342 [Aegilops tauschii subsp. strangulata]XP_044441722.1 uncharacterized protein LOC123167929 [Triticum aestivum]
MHFCCSAPGSSGPAVDGRRRGQEAASSTRPRRRRGSPSARRRAATTSVQHHSRRMDAPIDASLPVRPPPLCSISPPLLLRSLPVLTPGPPLLPPLAVPAPGPPRRPRSPAKKQLRITLPPLPHGSVAKNLLPSPLLPGSFANNLPPPRLAVTARAPPHPPRSSAINQAEIALPGPGVPPLVLSDPVVKNLPPPRPVFRASVAPLVASPDYSMPAPSTIPVTKSTPSCVRPDKHLPPFLKPEYLVQFLDNALSMLDKLHDHSEANLKPMHVGEVGIEMARLGKTLARDDEISWMEAGLLPPLRSGTFNSFESFKPQEDSQTNQLIISQVANLVGNIYRDLPENLQKELLNQLRRATEQPADNSRQAKGWMWPCSSVCVSLASHLAMFLLSALWPRSESVKEESAVSSPAPSATEKSLFLRWGVEKVIGPFLMCGALTVIRKFVISKEIWKKSYKANEMVNLWINTFAKGTFFAVKEFPVTRGGLTLWAHLASFAIELLGATWLLWSFGFWESDVVDS